MSSILGVVNLDMFGYDNDKDMCIELHVGSMPASNTVGTCFTNVSNNYNLGLKFDYLVHDAKRQSDHASFWDAEVGAIEVLENFDFHPASYGCGGVRDRNPSYHKTTDLISNMYMPATHRITQTGVGTVASMAGMMGKCFNGDPRLTATPQTDRVSLTWPALQGADVYRVYRGTKTCGGEMSMIAEVSTNAYVDNDIVLGQAYFYKVMAAETDGACISQMSNCAITRVPKPPDPPVYFYQYIPATFTSGE
jgi:hypothetical protein